MAKSRQQGMLSLEFDIDNPRESEIFSSYPNILSDNTVVEFITDYLRLMVSGNMNAFEIETLMDEEIETIEHESEVPASSLTMMGDGLPAFGIVAVVMGVVHSLAYVDRPAAELGMMIAHAMVGYLPGDSTCLRLCLPISRVTASEKCRKNQSTAVH